jgi:hypothetical protein
MRFEAFTNVTTKVDKQSLEVLSFMSKCSAATKNIPVPDGMKLEFHLKATSKAGDKVLKTAISMNGAAKLQLNKALDQADAAAERSSRKAAKKK